MAAISSITGKITLLQIKDNLSYENTIIMINRYLPIDIILCKSHKSLVHKKI